MMIYYYINIYSLNKAKKTFSQGQISRAGLFCVIHWLTC